VKNRTDLVGSEVGKSSVRSTHTIKTDNKQYMGLLDFFKKEQNGQTSSDSLTLEQILKRHN
jgi:hypothetical protein